VLAIHAVWEPNGALCLWGEDPDGPVVAPARRGRPPRQPRPRTHPFACGAPALVAEVAAMGPAPKVPEVTELTLMLPSAANGPQASPRLLRAGDDDTGPINRVAPWIVPAVALDSSEALHFLTSLPPGTPASDSVTFFAEVVKLALEFAARGRVLPAVEQRGERWAAVWRPAPATAEDRARLRLLAEAMPPACRAIPGEPSADAVLHHSLGALVDACARDALDVRDLVTARRGRASRAVALQVAWRRALAAREPWVDGDPDDLELLHKELEEWAYPAEGAAERPFRTCFRLAEPEEEGARWRLEILMQATDDPSLLVPADAVWDADDTLAVMGRVVEDPHELLLADLGRAVRLCPALAGALDGALPTVVELDAAGAHKFLSQSAMLLEQAGFGVLVPPWWRSGSATLGVKLTVSYKDEARVQQASLLGVDGLLGYRWKVAVGDEELTLTELKRLARLKAPIVQVRGRWVELRPEDLQAALKLLDGSSASGTTTLGEAMRTGLGLTPGPAGMPVLGVAATGRLQDVLNIDGNGRTHAVRTPRGFSGKLRPYQERGLGWLTFLERFGLGACLADDMGLGKTPTLLALLVAERDDARPAPTLVVCPMSVVGNWQREAARFAPSLRVLVHHGSDRLTGAKFRRAARAAGLVLTTYALAARDRDLLSGVRWGRVVLDEAQNIKNGSALQTRAVRSLPAAQRVALTGTPVENRLSELWSIMEFLNPGLLGAAKQFRERFAVPIERYRDEEAAEALQRITRPFVLRRLKTDKAIIKDLPDKIEMKVFCNLTREQASLYQAVVDDMLEKIEAAEGMGRKGLVLATMLRLKQVCNHPAHFLGDRSALNGRSGKLQRLEEILEEVLAEGDKALCFTQFAALGHMLKPHLQDRFRCEIPFLHGGTSKRARDEMVARFQEESGAPVLLVSLKAGGTGLNLTAATHVIHFDRWWNPAVEDQATDRAYRIGQTRNVQVRKFICEGTLEDRIDALIESKKDLARRIVGSGESWLTELSTAELREIVALSPAAGGAR
jgi:hypothetical protein